MQKKSRNSMRTWQRIDMDEERYKQIAEEISNEYEREFVLDGLMFGYLTATWIWWMKEERNNGRTAEVDGGH